MNQWFEIFRTGRWTDSRGRTREWTEADLDHVAKSYDPATLEAPLVVGHPTTNAPAYGWVEKVKREGPTLLAKAKQVVPEFAAAVRQGLYKKRSVSLTPDGRLRHVGFLGGAQPAVPGLADLTFEGADEAQVYEFAEQEAGPQGRSAEPTANKEFAMETIEELQAELAKERAARETAEQAAAQTAADFAAAKQKNQRAELDVWLAGLERDGKALPAWRDLGLVEFLTQLDTDGAEYEFAAADGAITKQAPAAWMRQFVEHLGSHPLFKEMSRPEGDARGEHDAAFAADEKLAKEIVAKVQAPKAP